MNLSWNCNSTCCNPDNSSFGDWCVVEDADCEGNAEWGYCRPEGLILGECQDSPFNWKDSDDDSCYVYGVTGWCLPTGKVGPNWNEADWGSFDDYAVDGKTAAEACCVCGGGANVKSQCVDTVGWKDTDGDECSDYLKYQFCSASGGYGSGWHSDWGVFTNYSVDNVSATDACCACGGGAKSETGSSTVPNVTRHTLNDCACKKYWAYSGSNFTCNTSCCNPDNDQNGDWCMVANSSCEDSGFGYCRESRPSAGVCHDTPLGWKDSTGSSCSDYSTANYCTETGEEGSDWHADWGTIEDYKNQGHTAATACCGCGGGSMIASSENATSTNCTDAPEWSDSDGDSCVDYGEDSWCNSTGGYGAGWHLEWGTFADFAVQGSYPAPRACCVCGGGSSTDFKGNSQAMGLSQSVTTTTNASAVAAGCQDVPGWADNEGDSCLVYESGLYCTSSGGYGDHWEETWGNFATYAWAGFTADTACCKCGGGVYGQDAVMQATAAVEAARASSSPGSSSSSSSSSGSSSSSAGSAADMAGASLMPILVVVAAVVGLGTGCWCYRSKSGHPEQRRDFAVPGLPMGRKYQTMNDV